MLRLLVKQGRRDEALKLLDNDFPESERNATDKRLARAVVNGEDLQNLSFDSADPRVHLEEGQRLTLAGRYEEAEDALRRAVATGPTQPETWLSLIDFLTRRSKLAEAEAAIRDAQIQLPEYLVPVICGQGYELIGQREQALDFYTRAYNADPSNLLALRSLAGFYINGSRANRALKATAYSLLDKINEVASAGADDESIGWARRQKAKLLANGGSFDDFQKALQLLDQSTAGAVSAQDNLLWVDLASKRGLEFGSGDPIFRLRAIERLEAAAKERDLIQAEKMMLAQLYESTNRNWDRCRSLMQELLSSASGASRNQLQGMWVSWLLKRNLASDVQGIISTMPEDSMGARRVNAQLAAKRKDAKQVSQILKAILSDPAVKGKSAPIRELASFTEELAKDDPRLHAQAKSLFREYAKREPAYGNLLLASYLGRHGSAADVETAFSLLEQSLDEKTLEQVVSAGLTVIRSQMANIPSSHAAYKKLEGWIQLSNSRNPNPRALALRTASLEELRGNTSAAESQYRKLLQSREIDATEQAIVSNNLAFVLALQGNGPEAERFISFAVKHLGTIEDVLDTRAIVHLSQKRPADAKRDLQHVVTAGTEAPEVYFHLARAEHMLNNRAAAEKALNRALELGLKAGSLKPIERPMLNQLIQQLGISLSQAR